MKRKGRQMTALFLAGIMAAMSLAGCEKIEDTESTAAQTNSAGEAPSGGQNGNSSGEAAVTPEEQWAIDAGLYEDESSEELYQKALNEEGGKVVIYSISSRMAKVKTSFEEDYPGMTLEVYDINANDMSTKLSTEYNFGIRTADVIHSK